MKRLLFWALVCCTSGLAAQPAGALPGKCYANCYFADQYHTITEQVMLKPALARSVPSKPAFQTESVQKEIQPPVKRYELIPAIYDTMVVKIEIKPPTKRYIIVPAEYQSLDSAIMAVPDTRKLIAVPAVYENVTEQIMVHPGGSRFIETPAEFETVWEEYETEPAYTKVVIHEPKFEITTEEIEIKPATLKWIRRKGDPNCLQTDPEDCFVWCLVEEPAEYQTVNKRRNLGCDGSGATDAGCVELIQVPPVMGKIQVRKLKTPASIREEKIEPKYMTVTRKIVRDSAYVREEINPDAQPSLQRQVVRRPAEVRVEQIPGEYLDVRQITLKSPAGYREVNSEPQFQSVKVKALSAPQTTVQEMQPAEYITVAKRVLVRPGGFSEWREVLCDEKITGYTISQIQSALKARGYDTGPANNQLTEKTKSALKQFQLDNDLPVGNLDFETLNALGIKY